MKKKFIYRLFAIATVLVLIFGCEKDDNDGLKIELSQTETYNFPPVTSEDYEPVEPLTVTITNTGSMATGRLTIVLDGPEATDFETSTASIANIEPGQTATFTVAPRTELSFGDYMATVFVTGKGIPEKKFDIRFVVTELVVDAVNIVTLPDKLIYGIGEPLDLTGLVVTALVEGEIIPLEIKEEYLRYDFSTAGTKKVGIAVGSAPVQEFEVTVLNLAERVKAALGKTETIIIYASEIVPNTPEELYMSINVANTNLTLTTPAGSTAERIIKKGDTGYLFLVNGAGGNIKLTIDGYVTLQGWAKPEYGGTDEFNNNNPLVYLNNFAVMEMKGNSKITGNAQSKNTTDAVTGGAVLLKNDAELILDESAQISNNWVVNQGTGVTYGGAFYLVTRSVVRIKGNAKITNNTSLHIGGNSYGGVAAFEDNSTIYMEGGEMSNNLAHSTTGIAGGGALQLIPGSCKFIFSGGTIKDNKLKFVTSGRGSAINAGHAQAVIISESASIPSGTGDITIDTNGLKTDSKNAVSLAPNGSAFFPININGTLSTTSKITVDLQTQTGTVDFTKAILRNYNNGDPLAYTDDAPASKFELHNLVNYSAHTITSLANKKINPDGSIGDK